MSDNFGNLASGLDSPARSHRLITPGTGVIAPLPRCIYCNTAGTVTMEGADGVALTYTVTEGQIIPFRARRITAATATVFAWE